MRLRKNERGVPGRRPSPAGGWPCWGIGCGLLVGLALYAVQARADGRRLESRLEEHVSDRSAAFQAALQRELALLHALRAFFQASREVEAAEFAIFTQELLSESRAVRALGWAPGCGEDRAGVGAVRFEESVDDGRPLRDLVADAAFATACAEALRSDAVVLAAGARPDGAAFLALRDPAGSAPGLLLARLDLVGLVRDVFGADGTRADFSVATASAGATREWLPSSADARPDGGGAARHFEVAGTPWSLRAWPNPAFLARHDGQRGLLAAFLGGSLWMLAHTILLARARNARARAVELHDLTLTAILQSLEEGVLLSDASGRVLFSNESLARLIGPVEDTPLAAWPRRYGIHADETGPLLPHERLPLARALRGERVPLERLYVRSDAAPGAWLSASAVPLTDRGPRTRYAVLVLRDITRQLDADATIRKLSSAVEQTADMVFVTDSGGRLLYGNASFAARAGLARNELRGRDVTELWDVRSSPPLARTWVDGVDQPRRRQQVWVAPTGVRLAVDEAITPIRDAEGLVTAYVSVCRDLTERQERLRLADELGLASLVQARLYPRFPPSIPGLDLAGACFPAKETCGDYFDFLELRDGRLVVVVGDIAGHGFGPALLMAEVRAYLRSLLPVDRGCRAPDAEARRGRHEQDTSRDLAAAALEALNRRVEPDFADGVFLTVIVAVIDPVARVMEYASAGHESAIVLARTGALKALAERTGAAVGLQPELEIRQGAPVELEAGDTILFVTDGLSEIHDEAGELFGHARILRRLRELRGRSAAEIVEGLRRSALDFSATGGFEDDVTIVCCKLRRSPAAGRRARAARVPRSTRGERPALRP